MVTELVAGLTSLVSCGWIRSCLNRNVYIHKVFRRCVRAISKIEDFNEAIQSGKRISIMKKKKSRSLRQIIEDNKQSIVFFLSEPDLKKPTVFFSTDDGPTINLASTTGFFVAPDKIVTTIGALSKALRIAAFSAVSFQRAFSSSRNRSSRRRKRNQILVPNEDVLEEYTIEGITAYDTKNNLVLLKIEETGVPLPLGDSDTVEIGETVYAIGNRDEPRCAGAAGYLQSRYGDDRWLHIRIHFSGAGSGSPVLNSKQEVIGVFAYVAGSSVGDSRSMMGTAVSSNVLQEFLANAGEVIWLDEFQADPRVRAYALEARADEKLSERNKNREAIRDYNAALKLNPDLVEIYFKRGIVKLRIGQLGSAIKDFDKMIEINPEHIFAYNNRASAKGNLGNEQGLLEDLNKAIEINPEYAIAHVNLAELKIHLAEDKADEGDIGESKRYYQAVINHSAKALKLDPRNPLAERQRRRAQDALRMLKSQPEV